MYPDSHPFMRFIFKLYHDLVVIQWRYSRHLRLPAKFAPQDLVEPLSKTNRDFYEIERRIYRMHHNNFAMDGSAEVGKKAYYIYSLIAKKYGWPYIKEPFDNTD